MCNSVHISEFDEPLELKSGIELSIVNPYSKVSCLLVQMFSMELGSPPLYAEANRVSRDMDYTHFKELGPYLKVVSKITELAEGRKD